MPIDKRDRGLLAASKARAVLNKDEVDERETRTQLRKEWLAKIKLKAAHIFEAQMAAALGHFKEVTDANGTKRVYLKSPDAEAIQWILEHVWGKATQHIDLDVDTKAEIPDDTLRNMAEVLKAWGFVAPPGDAKKDDKPDTAGTEKAG